MKIFNAALLVFFLILMSGCASVTKDIKVDAQAAKSVMLSDYKSYAWLGKISLLRDPEKKWQPPKMNIAGDIKYLIDRELRKRAIFSHATDPDLAVAFFMGVDMKAMTLKVDPETQKEMLENVPRAALVVVLIDTETDYVVWMGKATADLQINPTDEIVRERLDFAVSEMFRKIPMD